jgi:hypothetical protein
MIAMLCRIEWFEGALASYGIIGVFLVKRIMKTKNICLSIFTAR